MHKERIHHQPELLAAFHIKKTKGQMFSDVFFLATSQPGDAKYINYATKSFERRSGNLEA